MIVDKEDSDAFVSLDVRNSIDEIVTMTEFELSAVRGAVRGDVMMYREAVNPTVTEKIFNYEEEVTMMYEVAGGSNRAVLGRGLLTASQYLAARTTSHSGSPTSLLPARSCKSWDDFAARLDP